MGQPASDNWRTTIRARLFVGAGIFVLWAVGIQARLLYLQVHKHKELEARAANQSARTMDISAKRGDILDRHGRVLAYSVESDSVYGVPSEIKNAPEAAWLICGALGDCASKEQDALAGRLQQKRAFVYVRRRVTPQQARRVSELQLEGIDFIKEDRRFYPKKELAAQLLGFVGIENKGLAGIESAYDSADQRLDRQAPLSDRRARPGIQPVGASAHGRGQRRAQHRRVSAARRRKGASRRGRAQSRRWWDGHHHGPPHRRDSGDGQ